jgi:2',3'-cyclic-nucleotide 2'-phosphodiesterase (5'-nucleotidase family)
LHGAKEMKSKDISSLIPLFFLAWAPMSLAKEKPPKHHLTIVYTNDVQGEIEPCG